MNAFWSLWYEWMVVLTGWGMPSEQSDPNRGDAVGSEVGCEILRSEKIARADVDTNSGLMARETSLRDLNDEIIESVLSYLPLADLTRSRLVSSEWNRLISSKRFIVGPWSMNRPRSERWLLLYDEYIQTLVLYNPRERSWHSQRLEITPGHLPRTLDSRPFPHLRMANTSARGLIFLYDYVSATILRIRVCNPLTGAVRQLPQLVYKRTVLLTIDAMEDPLDPFNYKVIVSGYTYNVQMDERVDGPVIDSYPLTNQQSIEIYECRSDSWEKVTDPSSKSLPLAISSLYSIERFRNDDGKLIYLDRALKYRTPYIAPTFLEVYDIVKDSWSSRELLHESDCPAIPSTRKGFKPSWPLFVLERKHCMLVGVMERDRHNECRQLVVWKIRTLQMDDFQIVRDPLRWTLLTRMPKVILREFHIGGPSCSSSDRNSRSIRHPRSSSVVRESLRNARLSEMCFAVRNLRYFPVADDVGGDQLIFMSNRTQKIACFSFKKPISGKSWTSITHPAILLELERGQQNPSGAPARALQRWNDLDGIVDVLRSGDLRGTCFTPRPDVVP